MKDIIINKTMDFITSNKEYDKVKLEEMRYGLASIYLTFSKIIIISIISLFLGIFKEMIILMLIYNLLRGVSFGLHATKSWICLLFSVLIFIGGPLVCMHLQLNKSIIYIIGIITTILIYIYSPADTKKRPIVNLKRRWTYKVLSTIIAIIFLIIAVVCSNQFISNCLILSLIIQSLMINPLVYRLFKMPYNNYKNYKSV